MPDPHQYQNGADHTGKMISRAFSRIDEQTAQISKIGEEQARHCERISNIKSLSEQTLGKITEVCVEVKLLRDDVMKAKGGIDLSVGTLKWLGAGGVVMLLGAAGIGAKVIGG
jgi:hypothetical protein